MKKTFRIVASLEGLSYIILLFIAVPLKYMGNQDFLVKLLGMPHGLLFMAYLAMAILLKDTYQWSWREMSIIIIASILPFGTFYIDKMYLKSK